MNPTTPVSAEFERDPDFASMPGGRLRLGAAATRVRELYPLTALGAWVAIFCGFSLYYWAYRDLDLVFLVAGYGMLGLIAASLLLVAAATLRLGWLLRRDPEALELHLETERLVSTGYRLPALRFLPWVRVRIDWHRPGARVRSFRSGAWLQEEVSLQRRGVYTAAVRRVTMSDVFGLAAITVRQKQNCALRVSPAVGALRRLELLPSFAGGEEWPHPMGIDDGDRVELRRYVPGDSARFIHWGVFARTRKLMVRVPERALSRAKRTAAYLVTGPEDGPSAAAARVAVESTAFGPDWVFGVDGAGSDARSIEEALAAIDRSGSRTSSSTGLASFVRRAEADGPAAIVVFAPPNRGDWYPEVLRIAKSRPGRVRLVVGVDGMARSRQAPLWKRMLFGDAEGVRAGFERTEAMVRGLTHEGVDVHVIDRSTGRLLGLTELRSSPRRNIAA